MTLYTSSGTTAYDDDANLRAINPNTNFGTDTSYTVGFQSGTIYRVLLKFDLTNGSNPPSAGASTLSAGTVTLYCETTNVKTVALYKCLRSWPEGSVTWTKYDGSNNWTTAGAASDGNDYSSTLLGSVTLSGASGSYDIPLTAAGITAVQGWVDGPATNYGFVIRNTVETGNANTFTSLEGGTAANRPKLTFTYSGGDVSGGYTLILNTT
jgi:hypothetical protein